MSNRYTVNPILCFLAGLVSVFCLSMALVMIRLQRPGSALLFGAVCLLFGAAAVFYGGIVEVDARGVRRTVLGRCRWEKSWAEIREIGVCGTRVFNGKNSKNVGSLYLYFSDRALDEQKRFEMILKWPPRDICFMLFRYDRLRAVQMLWDKKMETYNAGDFSFGEGLKN